jgi:hypothetical protein
MGLAMAMESILLLFTKPPNAPFDLMMKRTEVSRDVQNTAQLAETWLI